jgi:hypothetical protein
MADDDDWIDEIEQQMERYLEDNFPDGLHIDRAHRKSSGVLAEIPHL